DGGGANHQPRHHQEGLSPAPDGLAVGQPPKELVPEGKHGHRPVGDGEQDEDDQEDGAHRSDVSAPTTSPSGSAPPSIRPSRMLTMRWAVAATSRLCVTITMVWPSRFSSRNSSMTDAVDSES